MSGTVALKAVPSAKAAVSCLHRDVRNRWLGAAAASEKHPHPDNARRVAFSTAVEPFDAHRSRDKVAVKNEIAIAIFAAASAFPPQTTIMYPADNGEARS
jgi:hypothetical protein